MVKSNISGRKMVKYASTKSDPLCKWRNATVETVVELVGFLPKTKMTKSSFRNYMSDYYDGSFFRTAYQLALQLGLYCEENDTYIPRFDHAISKEEATAYMHKWMQRYYVPNPYTKKGFVNIYPPFNLLNALVDYLNEHPDKPNLLTAGAALIGGEMGNYLNVKYVLNNYSSIIYVDSNNDMQLLVNRPGIVDVMVDRDDKIAFFEHFN